MAFEKMIRVRIHIGFTVMGVNNNPGHVAIEFQKWGR
jgi:hypothetical protein